MKKIITFLFTALISASIFAQPTVKPYNVQGFSGIDASAVFSVEVVKSGAEYLKIETDFEMMKYIEVKVKNNVLYLGLNTDIMPRVLKRNTPQIKAKIGMKTLEKINMSGASKIVVAPGFNSQVFNVELSGASYGDIQDIEIVKSNIEVNGASKLKIGARGKDMKIEVSGASNAAATINLSKIDVEVSGAASANLSGTADFAKAEVSGASSLKADVLNVGTADLRASGASRAHIGKVKEISVYASGASSIRYYGNPVVRIKEVSGASSVKQLE
jgi:hypothetical protein